MKTQDCQLASGRIAMTPEATEAMHHACPGAYINQDGQIRMCECECHPKLDPGEYTVREPLPVLREPDPAPEPAKAPQDPKKTQKRPRRGTSAGAGRCEHCGAPTGGRFAVGHDAKLKSELAAAANRGDRDAMAELMLRGWWRLVQVPAINKFMGDTMEEAREVADREGYALVERRNRVRQGISSEGTSR